MDKVLNRGPWRFMGCALEVGKWKPGKQLTDLFTGKMHIWVQIHNLPVEYRNRRFAVRFAEKTGTVIYDAIPKEPIGRIN